MSALTAGFLGAIAALAICPFVFACAPRQPPGSDLLRGPAQRKPKEVMTGAFTTIPFTGAAKRLEDIDLPRIGSEIGVGEDVIHAIIDVEEPKSGFDDHGRPRILFGPHVFYRCLPQGSQAKPVAAGLAYAGERSGTYGPESAQYGKLERAMAIHETAAPKACSWGRSQILGENHLLAGYAAGGF